jgi:DNA-binding NarL/FixJ family response regulator
MKIKIMIVDDQRLMREGLKTILDLEQDLTVVELAENGRDALDKMADAKPDVILMDIRMPVMGGVQCTRMIKQQYPGAKIIVLTTFDDDEYIIEALKSGAAGYILKDLPSEKLVGAIRDAYKGNSIMQPEIAAKVISHITGTIKEPMHCDGDRQPGCTENLLNVKRMCSGWLGKGCQMRRLPKRFSFPKELLKII